MVNTARTRKTSLSLDRTLLDEAKSYGINVSRAAHAGIEAAVRRERAQRWQAKHGAAIETYNQWVEEQGAAFGDLRKFPR